MTSKQQKPYFDGTNGSKNDELNALREMAVQFRMGSYLADFFTNGLREWLESQVENDFSPNIMLEMETLIQREAELEERVRQKNAEIDRVTEKARRYFESAEAEIARLDKLYLERGNRIEELEKAAETFEMEQKILNKEYAKAVERAAHLEQAVYNWQQLESAGRKTQSELEAARLEVQRLKAEAYDLMTGKK